MSDYQYNSYFPKGRKKSNKEKVTNTIIKIVFYPILIAFIIFVWMWLVGDIHI